MIEPADDVPPEHLKAESEMGAEEFLGRPLAGNPEERITALKNRINYLEGLVSAATDQQSRECYQKDLREADRQLKEWQAQHTGRN